MNRCNTFRPESYGHESYPREAGYASAALLGLLVFLSALASASALYFGGWARMAEREASEAAETALMDALAGEVLASLEADASPGVNSPDDPVWGWNGREIEGFRVSVYPLSDRLNLNFVRKNILENTRLAILFAPGRDPGELQQFREDRGLSLFIEDYRPFFAVDDPSPFFSCYGWANVNLIDEFAARKLARTLTGRDAAAEEVRAAIQKLLMEQRICGPENLEALLGINHDRLFPWFNAEPLININFAEPALLRELLSYDAYGVKSVSSRLAEIAVRREAGGIAAGDIPRILGVAGGGPLGHYLGSITWFWEIRVSRGERSRRTVACRLPGGDSSAKPVYRIIERRFLEAGEPPEENVGRYQ
ncbi:MAG: hypothetical protein LBQ35_06985 [Spirochaetaceae bacterium]|jgi:hypothetical protein|nr:hypothetical protein [Spirochaetaceae bacterium]